MSSTERKVRGASKEGKRMVAGRTDGVLAYFTERGKVGTEYFGQFVAPLVELALDKNVLSVDGLYSERGKSIRKRFNTLLLDLLLLHGFNVEQIPIGLLAGKGEKLDGRYIVQLQREMRIYNELKELDEQPGCDYSAYYNLFTGENEKNVAIIVRIVVLSKMGERRFISLDEDIGLLKLMGITNVITDEKWGENRENISHSALKIYSPLGDACGFPGIVRRIKDLAVEILYQKTWEYIEYEMSRLEERQRHTQEFLEKVLYEVHRNLKKSGITAKINIRKNGKAHGSGALKIKNRYEKWVVGRINEITGIYKKLIEVEVINPEFKNGDVRVRVSGEEVKTEVKDGIFKVKIGDRYLVIQRKKEGEYLFPRYDEEANDIVASYIVVEEISKKERKSDREKDLTDACYTVRDIISRVIQEKSRRNGVTEYGIDITDYIGVERRENGYKAIHLDVELHNKETFVPFEIQIKTTRMYEHAERGGAAHFIYKGGLDKQTTAAVRDYMEFVSGLNIRGNPEKQKSEQVKKTISVTIIEDKTYKTKEGRKIEKIEMNGNTYILDALVEAGVELDRIIGIVDANDKNIKLSERKIGDIKKIFVRVGKRNYGANGSGKGKKTKYLFSKRLARVLLKNNEYLDKTTKALEKLIRE